MDWTNVLPQLTVWLFDKSAHHTDAGKVTSAIRLRQGENEWK